MSRCQHHHIDDNNDDDVNLNIFVDFHCLIIYLLFPLEIVTGYSSPQLSDIPISPPPSYEAVIKEKCFEYVGSRMKEVRHIDDDDSLTENQ